MVNAVHCDHDVQELRSLMLSKLDHDVQELRSLLPYKLATRAVDSLK